MITPSRNEGLELAILEASRPGVPVIESAIGPIREMIELAVTSPLFTSENHHALAQAVCRLHADAPLRVRSASQFSSDVHARFCSAANLRRYAQLFQRALNARAQDAN